MSRKRNYTEVIATTDANDGVVVVPGNPSRTLTIVDAWAKATGTTSVATGLYITDTSDTVEAEWLTAVLADQVVTRLGAANTSHAGLGVPLARGRGIKVKGHGTLTTATAYTISIDYVIS